MDEEEEWRVIPDFPAYELNQYGNVRRVKNHKIVRTITGYKRVAYDVVRLSNQGFATRRGVRNLLRTIFPERYQ